MITTVIADGKKEYEFIEYLKKRAQSSDKNVIPTVSEILENVRDNGDKAVRDYVLGSPETQEFVQRTLSMLDYSVPLYLKEGKSELVVGVGCTGGKHRSITVARELEHHFLKLGYRCIIQHRDVEKVVE